MTKPLEYFSHLFGHEGENSLLSYLKEEGYAMALSAGSDHELGVFSSFTVEVTLTKKGLENYEHVLAAIFKYAQRLAEVGPQEFVFEECQKIGNLKFEFVDKGNCTSYCVGLARRMPNFPGEEIQHLIRSKYVFDSFDKKRIEEVGKLLADPKNTIICFASKTFTDESLPKKEHWYKIDYSAEKFTDEQVKLMSEPAVKENGKKLDLPPPNVLLPSKFEIHADSESKLTTFVKHWDESDLWFKKDDKFKKPKGNIAVKIYTNDLHFGTT